MVELEVHSQRGGVVFQTSDLSETWHLNTVRKLDFFRCKRGSLSPHTRRAMGWIRCL